MQHNQPTDTRRRSSPVFQKIITSLDPDSNQPAEPARKERPSISQEGLKQDGLYIISVASRILEMHPQTLRKYERIGLVRPSRTLGMLRLYSNEDIAHLRMIKYLIDQLGLNLAGVVLVMDMMQRLTDVRERLALPQQTSWVHLEQELKSILDIIQSP
jgi:MerR family transcriptional regulator/heat shock protein HspR